MLGHDELKGWFRVKGLELRECLELEPFLSVCLGFRVERLELQPLLRDICLSASCGNVAAEVLALFLSNLGLRQDQPDQEQEAQATWLCLMRGQLETPNSLPSI